MFLCSADPGGLKNLDIKTSAKTDLLQFLFVPRTLLICIELGTMSFCFEFSLVCQ